MFGGIALFVVLLILLLVLLLAFSKKDASLVALQACLNDMAVSKDMTSLVIPSDRCNDLTTASLSFSVFKKLKTLQIGSNCFQNVLDVRVDGLPALTRFAVEEGSFTKRIGSLSVTNCPSLTSLTIGDGSFSSFSKLTIASTNLLHTVTIGSNTFGAVDELRLIGLSGLNRVEIGSESFVLKEGSFHLSECSSLKMLTIGAHSFEQFTTFEVENDPALEALQIGSLTNSSSFYSASLHLSSMNAHRIERIDLQKLASILIGKEAFHDAQSVVFDSQPIPSH